MHHLFTHSSTIAHGVGPTFVFHITLKINDDVCIKRQWSV